MDFGYQSGEASRMLYSSEKQSFAHVSSIMLPFFNLMIERGASDLFLTSNAPPQLKIDAIVYPVNSRPLSDRMVHRLAYSLMGARHIEEFEREHEMNMRCEVAGAGNFRVNIFQQRGSVAMVVRYIAHEIPLFEDLALPESIRPLILEKRGMIFVVGGTGSGKSTTMAAMIQHRNSTQTGHILTLEDPIEFIFHHQKSIVNQREIGTDTHSINIALKNAMRESPDVLMIGEIRDGETLMQAISYAQSGHLCIASMHANNTYHMLSRVLSFFPSEARSGILMDLSVALKAIISQRLLPSIHGRQIPAVEVLINTSHISELIRNGEINRIKDAMSNSMDDASQTFEQALFKLYQEGKVELDQALKYADSPTNLYWLINHSGVQEVDMPEVDENSVDFSMHRQSTGKKPKMKSSGDKHAHS